LPGPSDTRAANFLIANNTFAWQSSAGIVNGQAAAVNNRVVNNISHENGVASRAGTKGINGVDFLNSGQDPVLSNDLFFAAGAGGTRMSGGNVVKGDHYTKSGSLSPDPSLVQPGGTMPDAPDFHLKPGSTAIDKGLPLPQVAVGRDGGARPWPVECGHDLGAYGHGARSKP